MRPTPPSWLAWYRRLRPLESPRPRDIDTPRVLVPGRLTIYTSVFTGDKHLPYLRLEDMFGPEQPLPTPPRDLLQRLTMGPDMWRSHRIYPDLGKESLDYQPRFHNYSPVVEEGARLEAGVPLGVLSSAWGGWAVGAVLLALLVLAVRAADKCLDNKFLNPTRRPSDEWHTPNVVATSHQHQNIDDTTPSSDDSDASSPHHHSPDLPPPYSQCARSNSSNSSNDGRKRQDTAASEEPPPPYSACVVSYKNRDIPTVHIHRHAVEDPTSSEVDNVQNDLIETRHRMEVKQTACDEEAVKIELVFEDGRVVERTRGVAGSEGVRKVMVDAGEKDAEGHVVELNEREGIIFV